MREQREEDLCKQKEWNENPKISWRRGTEN
jgi:hypothetical protein